ncbi:hypothetical protein [Brucella intermedia]|uniref:hypothetical protein n=1 Tax=Brucella intermedia TaxID=94625 RepID=UPI00236286D2|nr:hypothetical protein [Brucella intermedia]
MTPAASFAFTNYDDAATLRIEDTAGKVLASYTREQLKQTFPIQEQETSTPWTQGNRKIRYRGPYLQDVLSTQHSTSKRVEILAFDGFSTKLARSEIDRYAPILAIEKFCDDDDRTSGLCSAGQIYRALSLEDGGPIFLVWPMEKLPARYIPARNSIWVWFVVAVRLHNE